MKKNTKNITVQLNVYFVYIHMQADLCRWKLYF